jgi:Putative MetA-pathway of phenol degradation
MKGPRRKMFCVKRLTALAALALVGAHGASAQQLEPRAYAPNPVGVNIVGLPFTYQSGNVVTDPSLPVRDVEAKVSALTGFYDRTFSFFGRSASLLVALPYVWASVTGEVQEQERKVTRSGQGDLQLRFATNILGGPALTPQEFAHTAHETTLGASLVVSMPTGKYDGTKLINIGTNRFAFKPELGLVHPVGKWTFELYAGAWFFTANDDFFGGRRRTQDPMLVLQGHVIYTFLPGLWLAVDGTWYSGGQTTVNGAFDDDRQQNTRIGATLAVPLGRGHVLKAAWARGATVRIGQDFTTYGLTYQYRWF